MCRCLRIARIKYLGHKQNYNGTTGGQTNEGTALQSLNNAKTIMCQMNRVKFEFIILNCTMCTLKVVPLSLATILPKKILSTAKNGKWKIIACSHSLCVLSNRLVQFVELNLLCALFGKLMLFSRSLHSFSLTLFLSLSLLLPRSLAHTFSK